MKELKQKPLSKTKLFNAQKIHKISPVVVVVVVVAVVLVMLLYGNCIVHCTLSVCLSVPCLVMTQRQKALANARDW